MPGSTDEDDGIDFDEPKDDGIVIMVSKRTNYLLKNDLGWNSVVILALWEKKCSENISYGIQGITGLNDCSGELLKRLKWEYIF